MKFGDYIRAEREKKGWTQPEAAEACGIEQSYLSKLENGKAVPGAEVFDKLSKGFDLSLKAMSEEVDHPELEKLRDVEAIRKMLKQKANGQTRAHRISLLTGAAFVVLGSGLLAHAVWVEKNNGRLVEYIYESKGVIREGESPWLFKSMPSAKEMATLNFRAFVNMTESEEQHIDKDGNSTRSINREPSKSVALREAQSEESAHLEEGGQTRSIVRSPSSFDADLMNRLKYSQQGFTFRQEDVFMTAVEGGTRTWNLVDIREKQHTPDTAPYFILGIMSVVAGFMSLLVGWRWR